MDTGWKKAEVKNGLIYVSFKYDPFLVKSVRGIWGRRYNPATKTWTVPDTDDTRKFLQSLGFPIKPNGNGENEDVKVFVPKKAFKFQIDGIKAMVKHRKILLADDMGLGKTMQALIAVKNLDAYPVLVVCPATVKFNWANEIKKWVGRSVNVISGNGNKHLPDSDFHVINYDILRGNLDVLTKVEFKGLILDESHYIKSPTAQRTKAIYKLVKEIKPKAFFALTGTPILNRPIEIYSTLNLLRPDIFNNRWNFAKRYCGLKYNGFGWDMNGATNTEELNKLLLASVMIRRKKTDVLQDLPDKIRTVLPVGIDNRSEYDYAFYEFQQWLLERKGKMISYLAEALVKIEMLKQLVVAGKLKMVKSWIRDFLNETDRKLVVFATHKFVIAELKKEFPNSVVIDGSTKKDNRGKHVEQFQNDPNTRLIIGNLKAMGVGITLTAASDMLFVELGWTPAEHDQAEDRIYRIGQNQKVNIYYMVGKDTIEEMIAGLIDQKREIVSQIIDGKKVEFDTFTELLNKVSKM